MDKKFLVITPTHNRPNFLEQSINSVLKQNYPHHLLIIDDGTDPRTEKLVKKFPNTKVTYYRRQKDKSERKSAAYSENFGLELLRQNNLNIDKKLIKYITFLHDDDLLLPESLLIRAKLLEKTTNTAIVFGQELFFYTLKRKTDWRELTHFHSHNRLILRALSYYLPYHTFAYKKNFIFNFIQENKYLYDEELRYGEDRDLVARLLQFSMQHNITYQKIPKFLVAYRRDNGQNITSSMKRIDIQKDLENIYRKHSHIPKLLIYIDLKIAKPILLLPKIIQKTKLIREIYSKLFKNIIHHPKKNFNRLLKWYNLDTDLSYKEWIKLLN